MSLRAGDGVAIHKSDKTMAADLEPARSHCEIDDTTSRAGLARRGSPRLRRRAHCLQSVPRMDKRENHTTGILCSCNFICDRGVAHRRMRRWRWQPRGAERRWANVPQLTQISGTAAGNTITVNIDAASPLASVGSAALVQSGQSSFLVARTGRTRSTRLRPYALTNSASSRDFSREHSCARATGRNTTPAVPSCRARPLNGSVSSTRNLRITY